MAELVLETGLAPSVLCEDPEVFEEVIELLVDRANQRKIAELQARSRA